MNESAVADRVFSDLQLFTVLVLDFKLLGPILMAYQQLNDNVEEQRGFPASPLAERIMEKTCNAD